MATKQIPMSSPTNRPLPLTEYQLLSFDVYGTLIQYKAHILDSFRPLLSRLPNDSDFLDAEPLSNSISDSATKGDVEFLKLFQKLEDTIKLESVPRRFDEILREIWRRIAIELGVQTTQSECDDFGSEKNIASWPCFEGTLDALELLAQHYKLIALSNIDRYAWQITAKASGLENIKWTWIFTAEDFGDDLARADAAKLETMLHCARDLGIDKNKVLHVAQSLGHDHKPCKDLGISSVFLIGDGPKWGKEEESRMAVDKELVGYGWRCGNLKEFAEIAVEAHQGNKT